MKRNFGLVGGGVSGRADGEVDATVRPHVPVARHNPVGTGLNDRPEWMSGTTALNSQHDFRMTQTGACENSTKRGNNARRMQPVVVIGF